MVISSLVHDVRQCCYETTLIIILVTLVAIRTLHKWRTALRVKSGSTVGPSSTWSSLSA